MGLFIGILLVLCIIGLWINANDEGFGFMCGFLGILTALILMFCFEDPAGIPDTYYLEAEVMITDSSNNATLFTSNQGLYMTKGTYYDDSVYMLTMETKGTKSTDDDVILVVWRCADDAGTVFGKV